MFTLLVFTLLPLGLGGVTGVARRPTRAEGQFYVPAFHEDRRHTRLERLPDLPDRQPCAVDVLVDRPTAARALYGISRSGMTIKQFGVLNRFHVPARAMTSTCSSTCCWCSSSPATWRSST